VDVGAIFLILAGLAYLLVQETEKPRPELKVHSIVVERFRRGMKAQLICGVVFMVSALPFFWLETPIGYLRFVLWYVSIPVFIVWIPIGRRKKSS
jgi:hypothetical protein